MNLVLVLKQNGKPNEPVEVYWRSRKPFAARILAQVSCPREPLGNLKREKRKKLKTQFIYFDSQ